MDNEDKKKILKAMIISAVAASGIGAYAKLKNDQKRKEKPVENSKNTIIVPIKKSVFLDGLPSPEDLAKSRGVSQLPYSTGVEPDVSALSEDDIKNRKKEILANNGKELNFFGKAAEHDSTKNESSDKQNENDGEDDEHNEDDNLTEDKENDRLSKNNEKKYFRNQDGEFVSPTDPTAVEESEKNAEGIIETIIHPLDSAKRVLSSASDKPFWYTAGSLGALYLATKIADTINAERRKKAKDKLENARSEYVDLIQQGEEKTASNPDARDMAGIAIGTSFFVPMLLTSLVTKKILDNRKEDKKNAKDSMQSIPDEPIILYKTSEAKEIKTTPEAVLATFIVQRDMIMNSERNTLGIDKQAGYGMLQPLVDWGKNMHVDALGRMYPTNENEVCDYMIEALNGDEDGKRSLPIVQKMKNGQEISEEDFSTFIDGLDGTKKNKIYGFLGNNKDNRKKIISMMSTDPRVQEAMVKRFTNQQYANTYGQWGQSLVSDHLGKQFRQGSLLHSFIAWLANTFGFGKSGITNWINDWFDTNRKNMIMQNRQNPAASPNNGLAIRIS